MVVVILSIFAGMMTLSVGGSEVRRNQAFYEHVKSNINYIRLLSLETMQPYGIAIKLPQGGDTAQLVVVKLEKKSAADSAKAPAWQLEPQISPLDVPDGVEVAINSLQANIPTSSTVPSWLVGNDAPPVVWFGTGEATPAQITLTTTHSNGQVFAIADPLIINSAGGLQPATAATASQGISHGERQ